MSIAHFTDSNFKKEALESGLPVLVDFWADWCGPCKMIAPVLEELAREYANKIKIGKLDVGTNPKTASTYGIMSIPTLIFLKKGKVMEQVAGALTIKKFLVLLHLAYWKVITIYSLSHCLRKN